MERRQADQGLKGPRNDMVVSSLGFLFALCIQTLYWICQGKFQGDADVGSESISGREETASANAPRYWVQGPTGQTGR